jgi:HEAT repeat protein
MPKSTLPAKVKQALAAQVQEREASLGMLTVHELIRASTNTKLSRRKRSEAVELIGLSALVGKLRRQGVNTAVRILSRIVLTEHRVLAWSAAVSLGNIDEPSSVPKLIHASRKGIPRENRRAAIYALGAIGDHRAVEVLIEALRDPGEQPDLRAEAAEALAACGGRSKRAVEALTVARSDPSRDVRSSSASALRILLDRRRLTQSG